MTIPQNGTSPASEASPQSAEPLGAPAIAQVAPLPKSRWIRRATLFALLPIGVNIVASGIVRALDMLFPVQTLDQSGLLVLGTVEIGLFALPRLVNLTLLVFALIYAGRILRDVREGRATGRRNAIGIIVWSYLLLAVGLIGTIAGIFQILRQG